MNLTPAEEKSQIETAMNGASDGVRQELEGVKSKLRQQFNEQDLE